MARFGQPEEMIGAAVLLASDAASFITGQCIAVGGGFLASGVNPVIDARSSRVSMEGGHDTLVLEESLEVKKAHYDSDDRTAARD